MKKIALFVTIMLLLSACLKIEEASEIPEISLKEFKYTIGLDSLENKVYLIELTMNFIDGDGDIGSQDSINQLFITPLRKKYKKVADTLDTLTFKIPYIEPIKSVRTFNGEIKCEFMASALGDYQVNDTLIYEAFIVDRSEHKSNVISTLDFIFREIQ